MNTVGEAKVIFKLSEFAPGMTDWGHTAYISYEPAYNPLMLDVKLELVVFFTPRSGTSFEEVERLVTEMNKVLDKVHFNIQLVKS